MIICSLFALIVWLFVSLTFYNVGYEGSFSSALDEPRTKTNFNAIALFMNIRNGDINFSKLFKRKSAIDKDIEKELKKIRDEEKEIESMYELEKMIAKRKVLEIKKEQLFKEVYEKDKDENEYHCYPCAKFITGIDNFAAHMKKEHAS